MPRFRVMVAGYARMNFEQAVIVDARNKDDAEDKAVEIANAVDDWQPAGLPAFDGNFHVREPEKVSRIVPLTREKPNKRAARSPRRT